eukprot:2732804-Heterocapsa_arctica.AAC.1
MNERPKYMSGEAVPIGDLDIKYNYNAAKAEVFSLACLGKVHIVALGKFARSLPNGMACGQEHHEAGAEAGEPRAKKQRAIEDIERQQDKAHSEAMNSPCPASLPAAPKRRLHDKTE